MKQACLSLSLGSPIYGHWTQWLEKETTIGWAWCQPSMEMPLARIILVPLTSLMTIPLATHWLQLPFNIIILFWTSLRCKGKWQGCRTHLGTPKEHCTNEGLMRIWETRKMAAITKDNLDSASIDGGELGCKVRGRPRDEDHCYRRRRRWKPF